MGLTAPLMPDFAAIGTNSKSHCFTCCSTLRCHQHPTALPSAGRHPCLEHSILPPRSLSACRAAPENVACLRRLRHHLQMNQASTPKTAKLTTLQTTATETVTLCF